MWPITFSIHFFEKSMWKLKEPKVEGLLQKKEVLCEMNFSNVVGMFIIVLITTRYTKSKQIFWHLFQQKTKPNAETSLKFSKTLSVARGQKDDEPCDCGPKDPDLSSLVHFNVLALNKFRGHFSSETRRYWVSTLIPYFRIVPHAQWTQGHGRFRTSHQDHQSYTNRCSQKIDSGSDVSNYE